VYLFNKNGDLVQDAKFLVSDGGVKGQMALDRGLIKGEYYLAAYSSWMKNFDAEEIFREKILVRYETKTTYRLVPTYDRKNYFPGDTVKLRVKCYDNLRREVEDVSFVYRVSNGNDKILRGSANMYNGYNNRLHFVLPEDIRDPCQLELFGKHEGVELDRVCKLPLNFTIRVNFFPEGGQALNGMMSRMAFKAAYPNGKPARIKGKIINEKGEALKSVATSHEGMGAFPFIPGENKNFYLKITHPSAISKKYRLPEGKDEGWLLKAKNKADKIHVNIRKRDTQVDTCLLTLMIRGYLFYSRVVPVGQNKTLTIPTDTLPSGIGVVTLLDRDMLPRAERLVFVNYQRRHQAELTTSSEKYLPRDKVKLDIRVKSPDGKPVQGDYSLAVVDQKLGLSEKINQGNIFSTGYFSTEIRGRIRNPAYYFRTGSRQERYHLDLLLMTQGWRNYQYLEEARMVESLPDPVNQDVVSGKILKKRGILNPKPTEGKLIVYFGGTSHTLHTDEQGNFSFLPHFDAGVNPNIFLSATDENGKDNVIIRMDSNRYRKNLKDYLNHLTDSLDEQTSSTIYTYESIEKLYETNELNHYWIEAVTVTAMNQAVKKDPEIEYIEGLINTKKADSTLLNSTYDLYTLLNWAAEGSSNKLKRINDNTYYYYPLFTLSNAWVPVAWYVDGLQWPEWEVVASIQPQNIKDFYIIKDLQAEALYGNPFVVYITTKPYHKWKDIVNQYRMSNREILKEYTLSKEFYKPIYDTEEKKEDPKPDLRKTIHWEPKVQLDSTGGATVTFYNADRYTDIKCILQGISDKGIPVYGETGYEVFFMKGSGR
jgi:hypothetical protein